MIWILPAMSVSLLLIILGIAYYLYQPKEINFLYGYRTVTSMKNHDTWITANLLAAKYHLIIQGVILIILLSLLLLGRPFVLKIFGKLITFYIVAILVSTTSLLLPIFMVEYKLNKIFNSDGTRK